MKTKLTEPSMLTDEYIDSVRPEYLCRVYRDEIVRLQGAVVSSAKEAKHWKTEYEKLVATPDPVGHVLGKQLAATRSVLNSVIAQKNKAISARRSSEAFRHGMRMRERDISLTEMKKRGYANNLMASAVAGWIYMDDALNRVK